MQPSCSNNVVNKLSSQTASAVALRLPPRRRELYTKNHRLQYMKRVSVKLAYRLELELQVSQ